MQILSKWIQWTLLPQYYSTSRILFFLALILYFDFFDWFFFCDFFWRFEDLRLRFDFLEKSWYRVITHFQSQSNSTEIGNHMFCPRVPFALLLLGVASFYSETRWRLVLLMETPYLTNFIGTTCLFWEVCESSFLQAMNWTAQKPEGLKCMMEFIIFPCSLLKFVYVHKYISFPLTFLVFVYHLHYRFFKNG